MTNQSLMDEIQADGVLTARRVLTEEQASSLIRAATGAYIRGEVAKPRNGAPVFLTPLAAHCFEDRSGRPRKYILCVCQCLTAFAIRSDYLAGGDRQSCGCKARGETSGIRVGVVCGKWYVSGHAPKKRVCGEIMPFYQCVCLCGTVRTLAQVELEVCSRGGEDDGGCGCTRGYSLHPKTKVLYKQWAQWKHDIYNKRSDDYKSFGQRGIRMCKAWRFDFVEFYRWARQNGFDADTDKRSVVRIDPDKHIGPANCAVVAVQNAKAYHNCSKSITLFAGTDQCETNRFSQWIKDPRCVCANQAQFERRINAGFTPDQALFEECEVAKTRSKSLRAGDVIGTFVVTSDPRDNKQLCGQSYAFMVTLTCQICGYSLTRSERDMKQRIKVALKHRAFFSCNCYEDRVSDFWRDFIGWDYDTLPSLLQHSDVYNLNGGMTFEGRSYHGQRLYDICCDISRQAASFSECAEQIGTVAL